MATKPDEPGKPADVPPVGPQEDAPGQQPGTNAPPGGDPPPPPKN